MRHSIAICCIALLLISCEGEEKKPDYLWSQEKFIAVLTEVQIAEAIVRLGYNRMPDSLYLNDSIYASAFRLNEANKATFDSNLNYYLDRPEELEVIYDQVIVNLSQRIAKEKSNLKKLPTSPAQ